MNGFPAKFAKGLLATADGRGGWEPVSALRLLTAADTAAAGALFYGQGTSQAAVLASPGAAGRLLVSGASAPAWSGTDLVWSGGELDVNGDAVIGATARLGSERLRIAGGSAPGTPGATDVLVGAGALRVGATTASTSTTTGALTVAGGVGIVGTAYMGGQIQLSGSDAAFGALVIQSSATLVAGLTDGYLASQWWRPTYSGAFAVTRHNYVNVRNPVVSGGASVTDAALFRFDAAAGTHAALAAGTTKATPSSVSAWVKININGTLHYVPAYTSTTS